MKAYLIHGTYSYLYGDESIMRFLFWDVRPEKEVGHIFYGILYPGFGENNTKLVGLMDDREGKSELSNIIMEGDELKFTKRYPCMIWEISYSFKREGDIWEGVWELRNQTGKIQSKGFSRCIITEIDVSTLQLEV